MKPAEDIAREALRPLAGMFIGDAQNEHAIRRFAAAIEAARAETLAACEQAVNRTTHGQGALNRALIAIRALGTEPR